MRIVDISQSLYPGMPVYPGDPQYASALVNSLEAGDGCEVSCLTLGTHCGTHVDAPSHMIEGAASIDEMPLDHFVGPCRVVTLNNGLISKQHLTELGVMKEERLLIRTDPEGKLLDGGEMNCSAIDLDAAKHLVDSGVRLIGIDSPSIENMDFTHGLVHQTLLRAGVAVLEGLDLRHANEAYGYLCALPLKLKGENGSPCRAVLIYE